MAKSDFDTAAATVKSAPHSTAAWDAIEELARDQEKPDEIVALYRDVLQKGLDPQVVEMIGERAGAWCDEWFGDDPKVAEAHRLSMTPVLVSNTSSVDLNLCKNKFYTEKVK